MKNDLDSKFVLRVFEKIREHGKKEDSHYLLEGIKAYTDLDGYTLYIEDVNVKLQYGFHNKYHFDYESDKHLEMFESKLKHIDNSY